MIARKNTVEITNSKRSDGGNPFRNAGFSKDVSSREETIGPLDELEFGAFEPEPVEPDLKDSEKPQDQGKPADPNAWESARKNLFDLPRKYYIGLGVALIAIGIGLYSLALQTYTAETRLVFIVGDRKTLENENWSPMRELAFLQNPKTSSILTSRYFTTMDPMSFFNKADDNPMNSLLSESTVLNPMSVRNDYFKTPADFESWFAKSISFSPDFYGGQNAVSVKLAGPDPQLLKGVLLDYVSSYVGLRKIISAKAKEKYSASSPKEDPDNSTNLKTIEDLDGRIRKIDVLLSDYQMAMKLLESTNGTSKSFSLDPSSPIFATVARFQDKIIQLEIERGALETRFTPQSREIKSIDYQIDGVKGLLNQYLLEQVKHLNKDKEMLLAQKSEIENSALRKPDPMESAGLKDMNKSSGMLASGAKWYFVNDGLSVINENPFISEKPLLGKIRDVKDAVVAGLFSPGKEHARQSGLFMHGATNGAPGVKSSPTQFYGSSDFRGGPDLQGFLSQPIDVYHNQTNSFVRR